MNWLA
jgi:hypothetical protein